MVGIIMKMEKEKTMNEEIEIVSRMFNKDICTAMQKFFKTQKGRLTQGRLREFQQYVLHEVENSACYYLVTQLEMMDKPDICKYVNSKSGEFYSLYWKQGKEKLAKELMEHLSSVDSNI